MSLRIVFMGTPDFAVATLDLLVKKFNVVGVVTAPDKPSGRGLQIQESAVKKYAKSKGLQNILYQPVNLKDPVFLSQLESLRADLQIVVAFRMLPEVVWKMPSKGTINLHASLLPQYRGAAPINWAIINGDKKTGVTTFFIEKEIDTGNIIFQEEIFIEENQSAGDLHDRLMNEGARLMIRTINDIEKGVYQTISQNNLKLSHHIQIKPAPKISPEICRIDWRNSAYSIYNLIRGLSPYPAARAELISTDRNILVKIFDSEYSLEKHSDPPGQITIDDKNGLKVAVSDGFILIKSLQLEGKKRLTVEEFLNGFHHIEKYRFKINIK